MTKQVIECLGKGCEYFREYYMVVKANEKGTAFIPMLNLTEKRCKHPKVYKPVGELAKDIGVKLEELKICPLNG